MSVASSAGNPTVEPYSSPATSFVRSGVPYVLPDQSLTVVAANWTALTSQVYPGCGLSNPINVTAAGQPAPTAGLGYVWTGTNCDGTPATFDCYGWTTFAVGTAGADSSATITWTSAQNLSCAQQLPIYCFQQ